MKFTSLKLYHYPMTRSARVKWMLHEVRGDDFDVEFVDVLKGAMMAPEMLAKNPNHNLPMLDITWEDGTVQTMLESGAMVMWLADAFPEKKLAPPPGASRERADYLQMIQFGAGWMDQILWQIRLHRDLLPEGLKQPSVVKLNMHKFTKEIEPQLEARLSAHDFICGDEFTAADVIMGHTVNWARAYGLCESSACRNYLRRLRRRPAHRAAHADADQFGK